MKPIFSSISIMILSIFLCTTSAFAQERQKECKKPPQKEAKLHQNRQRGIGPVTAISASYNELSDLVKSWLNTHFKGIATESIKYYTLAGYYDIDLANDYEIKIATSGKVMKVEAPDDHSIATELLVKLLPAPAYNYLKDKELASHVGEVRITPHDKYLVKADKKTFLGLEHKQRVMAFDAKGANIPVPQKDKKHRK